MKGYANLKEAMFVGKRNRFLGDVRIDEVPEMAHIPNTGRLGELLYKENRVLLSHHDDAGRKTQWTVRFAWDGTSWVSVDSGAPNRLVAEALERGTIEPLRHLVSFRREVAWGSSRFDFRLEDGQGRATLLEVKGVTLVRNGCAYFPDAPTTRGIRHLEELAQAAASGMGAVVLFVIQSMRAECFSPNPEDPEFTRALRAAQQRGVTVLVYRVRIDENCMELDEPMKIAPQD